MYLPCCDTSPDYQAAISNYVGFIDYIVDNTVHSDLILAGDFNFLCSMLFSGYRIFNCFLTDPNLVSGDDMSANAPTYVNSALCQSSCIDHIFANVSMHKNIKKLQSSIISLTLVIIVLLSAI